MINVILQAIFEFLGYWRTQRYTRAERRLWTFRTTGYYWLSRTKGLKGRGIGCVCELFKCDS